MPVKKKAAKKPAKKRVARKPVRKVAKKRVAKKPVRKVAKKKVAKKLRCAAKTAAGRRCKRTASGKSKFCASHK